MKIFIAGASGAIGRHLVAQLVARGHELGGTTRSAAKTGALRALGAEPVIVNALDPDSVAEAVAKAEPEVVVHRDLQREDQTRTRLDAAVPELAQRLYRRIGLTRDALL